MKKHKILKFLNKKEPIKIDNIEKFIRKNMDGFVMRRLTDDNIKEICRAIELICKDNNCTINDLIFLNKGQDALTFEVNNKIIKLMFLYIYGAKSITEYVSHSIFILKPDREIIIDINSEFVKAHILEIKKLDTSKISERNVIDLYIRLREDGYLWEDTRARNIGRDENGLYQLIDYGELKCLHYLNGEEYNRIYNNHINYGTHYNDEYERRFTRKFK